jgi:hypothetical protein
MNNGMEMEMQDEAMATVAMEECGGVDLSMAQHVKRWQLSDVSKRQYTQAHGLNYWSFRTACKAQGAIVRRTRHPEIQENVAVSMPMLEIPLRKPADEGIELELTNGIRVHLRGSHAGLMMEKLLGALS